MGVLDWLIGPSGGSTGGVGKDLRDLQETGHDTKDAGRKLHDSKIAQLNDESPKNASHAGHVARDDIAKAGDMGIPSDRHGSDKHSAGGKKR